VDSGSRQILSRLIDAVEESANAMVRESTKRGLVRARRHGVVLGRPSIMRAYRKDIRAMSGQGLSGRKIASGLGVPTRSVFNELRRINLESPGRWTLRISCRPNRSLANLAAEPHEYRLCGTC